MRNTVQNHKPGRNIGFYCTDPNLLEDFDLLARQMGRTRSYLIQDAMQFHRAYMWWKLSKDPTGIIKSDEEMELFIKELKQALGH